MLPLCLKIIISFFQIVKEILDKKVGKVVVSARLVSSPWGGGDIF